MASVTDFLARRLKLTVNAAKSAVDRPSARAFLSFSFTAGPTPQRVVSPKALARFKVRVRELTRRTKRVSFTHLVEELSRYLVGWRGYFGLCEVPYVLLRLDQWTRRRLRAVAWDVLEAWAHPLRGSTSPRRQQDPGGQDREQCPWPLAGQPQPGALYRAAQRLLRPARPRIRCRRSCRLTPSNRRVRTRTHGGVGGAEPRGSPLSRLRYGPPGDCRGRPCGNPLRASRKDGPRITACKGDACEPLRCRGEPVRDHMHLPAASGGQGPSRHQELRVADPAHVAVIPTPCGSKQAASRSIAQATLSRRSATDAGCGRVRGRGARSA